MTHIASASFSRSPGGESPTGTLALPRGTDLFVVRAADSSPVVGYCACRVVVDELQIDTVAVRPADRCRGAARALLAHVLREAEARGIRRATLEVRASNEAARRLYARLGFEAAGVRRGYYRNPPDDALILLRSLSEAVS